MDTNTKDLFIIKNVRLETGSTKDDFEITATETDLFSLTINNGKIEKIEKNTDGATAVDAKGYLMLPAMKDMHIHLDKTYYGGTWKARSGRQKNVQDMIALEQRILSQMLDSTVYRGEKIIDLQKSNGADFTRTHVNIEPTSKLDRLKCVFQMIEDTKDSFDIEIVAFPQHGLFRSKSEDLMKEAAKMNIDFIGGLDPQSVDGDFRKSLDFTVQLALDYNKGIDIHLHDTGEVGLNTVRYLIEKVKENPVLRNKTFISHCYVLGTLKGSLLEDVAQQLADANIGIISTIPFSNVVMPIPTLIKHGVSVRSGSDSIIDHWEPFGKGNMLEKASLMAQLYNYYTEYNLSRCLAIATDGILPLDDKGNQIWPKVGDEASFCLVDVTCSAEAVARVSNVTATYHKGKSIYSNKL